MLIKAVTHSLTVVCEFKHMINEDLAATSGFCMAGELVKSVSVCRRREMNILAN